MRKRAPWIKLTIILTYLFLFSPIIIVMVMSFNTSQYGTLPFVFTTSWYKMLFSGAGLGKATWLSIWFSFLVTLASAAVGLVTSLGLRRMPEKWAHRFISWLNLAVIIPWLVLGVALLMIFNFIGLGRSYLGMFLGSFVCVLPYIVLLVYPALMSLDKNIEYAARTLGASSRRTLFTIVLPEIVPALLTSSLMAFMVCFNNFVIQYYLAPFGVRTLPMEIYNLVRVGYKPDINALATIMMLISISLVLLVSKLGYGTKKGLF
ncbi:MAG TPA: ABC transporter permease [Clostridiaceae bacterium]|nr:ABC transporter permease [Clostridiaceae bacterium]